MVRERYVPEMVAGSSGPRAEGLEVRRADKAATVDGVLVDFRHAELPPGEWEARYWWPVWGDSENHCGICFPTEARAAEEELRAKKRRARVAPDFSLICANQGDELSVSDVSSELVHSPFDHVHDATVKRAKLSLTRQNGDRINIPGRLNFYGVTQIKFGPQYDAYDRLAERVIAENGGGDPLAFELSGGRLNLEPPRSLGLEAAINIEDAEQSLEELRKKGALEGSAGREILNLISSVALAGFYQGKAELREAERQAVGSAKGRALGPQALRRDDWQEFATTAWTAEPSITRYAIFQAMVSNGVATESDQSSVYRALRKHPLLPQG